MDIIDSIENRRTSFRSKRDELIKRSVEDINLLRKGTSYEKKVETAEKLAKRINRNPFLAGMKNDSELELVLNQCQKKRNYSYLYKLLK